MSRGLKVNLEFEFRGRSPTREVDGRLGAVSWVVVTFWTVHSLTAGSSSMKVVWCRYMNDEWAAVG
jgi:hypothetical protein